MLKTLTSTRTWMVASLLAAASVFGQSQEIAANTTAPKKAPEARPSCDVKPVCPPKPCCPERPEVKLNCAYNAPARIEVDSCSCWDFYFGASFIYWEAMQDNMEYAVSLGAPVASGLFGIAAGDTTTAEILGHDFEYKPGFKILAGMNFDRDHWDGYLEYTWFSSKTSSSVSSGPDTTTTLVGITPVRGSDYFLQEAIQSNFAVFNNGSQDWDLSFQSLDAAIARTYYVGTKLTFRSIMGARFAWFTQTLDQAFESDGTLTGSAPAGTYKMKQNFSSWGAGLMAGLNTSWMLGEGFSMIGNGSVDILYTRVQTSNSKSNWKRAAVGLPVTYKYPEDRPDFLMPHMNLEFGFAWGDYLDCYKWHVDFAATYNFQVFWDANLFRDFTAFGPALGQRDNGNLQMHGLNLSARLDF